MPRRSIRASTEISGRSKDSYTVLMRSATRRGLSTCHSRKITSASSAEYAVALSIATWSKLSLPLPLPVISP